MEVTKEYAIAYVEVLEILKYLKKEQFDKIPKERIEIYEKYKDSEYKFSYDKNRPIKEQITQKTKAVLSNLFVRFISNDKDKVRIFQLDKEKIFEEEKKKTWDNLNSLFERKDKFVHDKTEDEQYLIEVKTENLFVKIFKNIKSILWGRKL